MKQKLISDLKRIIALDADEYSDGEVLDMISDKIKKESELSVSEAYFSDRLRDTLNQIESSLLIKAKEYVRNQDRLHNFNVGAKKTGKIREEVMADFRLKHEISVTDIRNDISQNILPTKEMVKEKYGDIINYYILEKISILHKIDNNE